MRIYILAIVSFVAGMAELIVGGILDMVADGLNISISKAGELIAVYSLVFAVASPILLTLTAKVERKRLMLITLSLFFIGNIAAFASPNYAVLFLSRMISAASGSLLVVLCVTIASSLVKEEFRARAIGIIFMGISGSLVLGVPVGLVIGNQFGWRLPFLFIAALTLVAMVGVFLLLQEIQPKPVIPLMQQLKTLQNTKILFAQLTSVLFLTGHLTLYAYLTPFLKSALHLNASWVSVFYFIFGVSAVIGGGFGGFMADKWGSRKSIAAIIATFCLVMFALPKTAFSIPLFLMAMVVWSMLSWAITPAMQNYLIESAPETSDIQQSLNNSSLHIGIALGSGIGGMVINQYSVLYNASIGGIFAFAALLCAVFSITRAAAGERKAQQI